MRRILLVDDSVIARQALKFFLEAQGFACDEVDHGAAALVRLEEGHGIDLVISDNQMPVLTGLELLQKLASHPTLPPPPFIMYSGSVTEAVRDQALQAGAYAVLSKPTEFSEIIRAIHKALATHVDHPEISIVIPVFNERESLPVLHEKLSGVLSEIGKTYEIVIIDDGSNDGSVEWSRNLVKEDPTATLVELRRRFGKATALQAGFEVARGDIIFTLDADLQDDPKEIPRFLKMLDSGYDLVSGWKQDRKDPLEKTIPSKFFNYVTSKMSGVKLHDFNCGFKAYRREVIEHLDVYGELYRYIPVVVHAKGFRVGELAVTHRVRQFGKSKYGLERFVRAPLDLFTIMFLTSFQKRPLHLFGLVGFFVGSLGFLVHSYLAILWFQGEVIGDRPLLMLGTLMIIVGIQILIFGLLGEMIAARSYRPSEVQSLIRHIARHGDQS